VHTCQRTIEGRLVKTIPLNDVSGGLDRTEPCGVPRETPNRAAAFFEPSKKAAADVSGGAGEQDCLSHADHLALLARVQ